MKRKSVDRIDAVQMQRALKRTLSLFDGDTKELLFFYLYKEHGISVYDPGNLSNEKIEAAFSAIFGSGADVLMEKFNSEIKGA